MTTLCKNAKVRYFRFHALRHLGVRVYARQGEWQSGVNSAHPGHENGTTTEIYLESIGDAEREAMKIFERVG